MIRLLSEIDPWSDVFRNARVCNARASSRKPCSYTHSASGACHKVTQDRQEEGRKSTLTIS